MTFVHFRSVGIRSLLGLTHYITRQMIHLILKQGIMYKFTTIAYTNLCIEENKEIHLIAHNLFNRN